MSRTRGFTLLEMGVTILIIVFLTMFGLFTVNEVARTKYARAEKDALAVYNAIWGTPDWNGYYTDVGTMPKNDIVDYLGASMPAGVGYDRTPTQLVHGGWRGPYVLGSAALGGAMLGDPWQRPWIINAATGTVTSDGPDGLFGTADDIVIPQYGAASPVGPAGVATGSLQIFVVDPKTGLTVVNAPADPDDVVVQVSDPNGAGVVTMLPATAPAAGQEAFTVAGLHPGRHLVTVAHEVTKGDPTSENRFAQAVAYVTGGAIASLRVELR